MPLLQLGSRKLRVGIADPFLWCRTTAVLLAMLSLAACTAKEVSHPELTATGGEPESFAGTLAAHNYWRDQVGTPPLGWSAAAATQAQQWADALAEEGCEIRHNSATSRRMRWGENIYGLWRGGAYEGYRRNIRDVTDSWAQEREWYHPQNHQCSAPEGETCGHYTQVVSALSTHVGCGRARCERAEVWVCNYAPPGNYRDVAPF